MATQPREQVHNFGTVSAQQAHNDALAAIGRILERLYHERKVLLSRSSHVSTSAVKSGQTTDQMTRTLSELERSIEHLETIRGWLAEDHQLLTLIDEAIHQRVRQMERRSQRFNIHMALATTIGGAVLGWLLAAVSSPQNLMRLLGH